MNSFGLLCHSKKVQFLGEQEDYEGHQSSGFSHRNKQIIDILATDHSFLLRKRYEVLVCGSGCYGGRRPRVKRSRSTFLKRGGILSAEVVGLFGNRFKVFYISSSTGTVQCRIFGCNGECFGHLDSFSQ